VERGRGGVEFEDLTVGTGEVATRGAHVEITFTLALNRGDIVEADRPCQFQIGKREVVAGLEYGVEGMRVGGERRIRVGPHLAYRDHEIPDMIPANAVLEFRVKLLGVNASRR
jgi:FKBP-type peptidyl-prolyl cis-trans isomerase